MDGPGLIGRIKRLVNIVHKSFWIAAGSLPNRLDGLTLSGQAMKANALGSGAMMSAAMLMTAANRLVRGLRDLIRRMSGKNQTSCWVLRSPGRRSRNTWCGVGRDR